MPVLNKSQIIDNINTDINDNTTRQITPEDIRSNLIDVVDSIHLLSSGESIIAGNISSYPNDNISVGELALNKIDVFDYVASGNVAVGYKSNYANHTGSQNSSLGNYSLSCNVYGSGNVAMGHGSLVTNVNGNYNVALGWNALRHNASGNNNIAIGNAAGHYIGEDDDFQFYLASHDITEQEICDHPDGSGLTPLLRGDLLNNRLAVNSEDLNTEGTLQVNGDLTPVASGYGDNLGTEDYGWNSLYVQNVKSSGDISLHNNLLPALHNTYNLGSEEKRFGWLYAENLLVSGSAHINNIIYDTINESQFYNKTLYLGSSGLNQNNHPNPYLTDEGLDGAGLVVQSSGVGYQRDYYLAYRMPDLDLTCLENDTPYSRSSWESNISINIHEGRHLTTDAVIGREHLNLLNENCRGIFLDNNVTFGTKALKTAYDSWEEKGNINYLTSSSFSSNTVSTHSGVTLSHNWYTRYTGGSSFTGFSFDYFDNNNTNDRLTLRSYNNSASYGSELVYTRDSGNFGISNIGQDFIPEYALDVRSSGGMIRTSGEDQAGIILQSDADNLYIYSNGDISSSLSIDGYVTTSGITLLENISPDSNLYVSSVTEPNRSQAIYFKDSDGNVFDLILSSGDILAPEFVYWDEDQNTFVGRYSNADRNDVNGGHNTAVGYSSLNALNGGSYNTVIGGGAGKNITIGSNNILIGYNAGEDVIHHSNRLRIGPFISGVKGTTNVIYVDDKFTVNGPSGDVSFVSNVDTEITHTGPSGSLLNINVDDNTFSFSSNSLLLSKLEFEDSTFLTTASGIKTAAGSGIQYNYDETLERDIVSLDFGGLDSATIDNNSFLAISTSGVHGKLGVSELSQFLNYENPQMFYEGNGCYNLVISNDTYIDHTKHCSTTFIGKEAGDYSEGHTNSVIIGTQAGQDSFLNNPSLNINIAAVLVGYAAGRKATNFDNSIFIGQSAGQQSIGCDNSIFIGNSAGQASKSAKSIGIGDNTLEEVDGENNIEILADNLSNNRLIKGAVDNKLNIGGLIAGDTCISRISIGGNSRITPYGVLEVSAKSGDSVTPLIVCYDSNNDLVAQLDQNGNFNIKGQLNYNQTFTNKNTESVTNIPSLDCGNTNTAQSGATPTHPTATYTFYVSKSDLKIGTYMNIYGVRSGQDISNSKTFDIISYNNSTGPDRFTFNSSSSTTQFSVYGIDIGSETLIITDGSISYNVNFEVVDQEYLYDFYVYDNQINVGDILTVYGTRTGGDSTRTFAIQGYQNSSGPGNVSFSGNSLETSFNIQANSTGQETLIIGNDIVSFNVINPVSYEFVLDSSIIMVGDAATVYCRRYGLTNTVDTFTISGHTDKSSFPTSITFNIGEEEKTFSIQTYSTGVQSLTISKSGYSTTLGLRIIESQFNYFFSVDKNPVNIGDSVTITATRTGLNLHRTSTIAVSSLNNRVTPPTSLTFEAGESSKTLILTTNSVGSETVNFGSYGSVSFEVVYTNPTFTFTLDRNSVEIDDVVILTAIRNGGYLNQPVSINNISYDNCTGQSALTFAAYQSEVQLIVSPSNIGTAFILINGQYLNFTVTANQSSGFITTYSFEHVEL